VIVALLNIGRDTRRPVMKTGLLIAILLSLAVPVRAQDGSAAVGGKHRFGVIAKAGAAIPVGEFNDLFGTGFAGYIELPYDVNKSMQLFASVGYTKFTLDNGKLNNELAAAGIPGTATLDAPYTVVPALAGLKFFSQYGMFWPYFTFSFGMYFQELKSSGTLTDGGETTVIGPTTTTWSQGAFGVGVGTMIALGLGPRREIQLRDRLRRDGPDRHVRIGERLHEGDQVCERPRGVELQVLNTRAGRVNAGRLYVTTPHP
jgi:hypothetical protein